MMDYATELRMKWLLRRLKLPMLFLVLLFFFASSIAEEPTVFDREYYREGTGIYIDTVASPVRVAGQELRFKWGYDVENVSVPYKFAQMPFWIEHDLPFPVDLCDGSISFKTTFPMSTYINWDYDVFEPNYRDAVIDEPCTEPFDDKSCFIDDGIDLLLVFCDVRLEKDVCSHTIQVEDGTYTTITRSHPVALSDLHSCPLERNRRYNLYHYAEIPLGEQIVFDVSLELNLPLSLERATFVIPAPSWTSTTANDYNTGNAFDFNWTKVTWDGNIMPTGDDRIHNDQNQAFYDQNLIAYWKFNDVNSTGNGVRDDTNNANNGQLINGADINAWGLWDTNAGYFDGVNDFVRIADSPKWDFTDNFSICMWAHPLFDLDTTGSDKDLVNAPGTWLFKMDSATNKLQWSISDGSWHSVYSTKTSWEAKKWYHLCVVQEDPNATFYIDGNLDNQAAQDYNPTPATNVQIGYWAYAGESFYGFIDEVKIYNRALSAAEIQADYNSWMNSDYLSPVKDAGSIVNWDAMDWNAFVDVNNNVTVDYRGCSNADCTTAGAWMGGFKSSNSGNSKTDIYADGNQYFQYRLSFDTNRQQWNSYRTVLPGNPDKGAFGHVSNVWVSYSTIPAGGTCDCPASGNWEINDGSVCTLSTLCNLSAGGLHISNGSLYITSTGTLSVTTTKSIIIEKTNSKLVIEKNGGKVVINK